MKQWVVDTWVIIKCMDFSDDESLDCIGLLSRMLDFGEICVDTEGTILTEYCRYLESGTFVSKWWETLVRQKGHICFFSNALSNKRKTHLIDNLKFDISDLKFVAVASKTKDNLLVSGDSDYNPQVCSYLTKEMGIKVLCPGDAKSVCR